MKKIYIVLTHSGTTLSSLIKMYTRDEFSHVSISLDKNLMHMYSFGRLHAYNPFWGGFVHEYINRGTYKRFYKTVAAVYSFEISDVQYENIRRIIKEMKKSKIKYKFNIIGLFAVAFHKRITRKNTFYCAEFVKYVLDKSGIQTDLPDIIRPENFKQLKVDRIYTGLLSQYTNSVDDSYVIQENEEASKRVI